MKNTRREFIKTTTATGIGLLAADGSRAAPTEEAPSPNSFHGRFDREPDRVWVGRDYWANPLEDWRIQDGRIECVSGESGRSLHLLTHQLAQRPGDFRLSVRLGKIDGDTGAAGFLIGVHDDINDYRGNCFFGTGVAALVSTDGELVLANRKSPLDRQVALADVRLRLEAKPAGDDYELSLSAHDGAGKRLGSVTATVAAERLVGNVALAHNPLSASRKDDARFWFDDWTVEGAKFDADAARRFGPVLWAMHTVSNSRGPDGYVMKIGAQMPPIGAGDAQTVRLDVREGDAWKTLADEPIDADARTAVFRVPRWPADREVPYRLVYTLNATDGSSEECVYEGTIRKEPTGRPLVFAGMTCQFYSGFPYAPVAGNLAKIDPDVLYFSGDQIYESNSGFRPVRAPVERSLLSYLNSYYMFGWAFGDLMRDRPTLCTADDHDVYHGNIWGEGGANRKDDPKTAVADRDSLGGYLQPVRWVNAVYRTNSGHHPDLYDPTPALQGMSVFYGDMVYGRVSFAVVSDRQFKSGPERVRSGGGRLDHVTDPDFDVSTLDSPDLEMLGRRQLDFLEDWVGDWRGADMKVFLSQTPFAAVATHHGNHDGYLIADLDSGGWPQSARNQAIRAIRKGFPLHVSGDQHLTSLVQYGVDQQRDGNWSFCTPAISVGYQRWWRADEMKYPYANRPAHGLPNTGEYIDGFGNKVYVYAVGNPQGSRAPNRYQQAQVKASGFGIIRIDCQDRTYTCESYRFLADLSADGRQAADSQYPGWPLTIRQSENDGRTPWGRLPEVSAGGVERPVLQVYDQQSDELVYALRLQENRVAPQVFADGVYTVKIGDPDAGDWKTFPDLKPRKA